MFSFKSNAQDETKRFIIQSKDASICDGGKLNLSVDVSWEMNNLTDVIHKIDDKYLDQIHHTVNWYVGENDITPIGKGSSFNTPEISSSKNYYASVNYSGGLSVITEDFKKVGGEGLIFDLFTPAVINSVDVYSNMPGKISVVIKKTDGTQIINKSFPVTNGLNKLPLNCSLPSGWGFIIEAFGLSPDIKLTTIKHDKWPISLGTFGEIVEGTENKKKYNYFFNWDVSTARVPVNATIVMSTQNVTTKTECDKYFWTETSETYNKSGIYNDIKGCHTEKLNLTITPSSKNSEVVSACDSYYWLSNEKKYVTSGTYTSTSDCITNELNLTIEQSKTNVTTKSATDSFIWGVNNKKYDVSGTYIETKGCLTEKLILNLSFSDTANIITTTKTQTFKEVKIGNQIWMKENLNVDHFRNGDLIQEADFSWNDKPSWKYKNSDSKNGEKYGKLYNWRAVLDTRRLAPEGWHIPTESEWKTLESYLGEQEAGKKMKSNKGWIYKTGGPRTCPKCENWPNDYRKQVPCHTCKNTQLIQTPIISHSGNGTNSSGFNALPGGGQYSWREDNNTAFWSCTRKPSSTRSGDDSMVIVALYADYENLRMGDDYLNDDKFCYIRCIKD